MYNVYKTDIKKNISVRLSQKFRMRENFKLLNTPTIQFD